MKLVFFEFKKIFRSVGIRSLCVALIVVNLAVCLLGNTTSYSAEERLNHIDSYASNLSYIIRVAEINKAEYEIAVTTT